MAAFISAIGEGDVVWDVGAFVGLYTVLSAKRAGACGTVCAFEPESWAFDVLCRNIRLNRLQNVRALRFALGADNSQAQLFLNRDDPGVVGSMERSAKHQCGQPITVRRGDHLVAAGEAPVPHLVKIDVEGAEYQVILGMQDVLRRPECRLILLEVHSDDLPRFGATVEDLVRILDQSGFQIEEQSTRGSETHWLARKGGRR